MPKAPRLTAPQAERLLLGAAFVHVRSRGGHRIYQRQRARIVLPFHPGKMLHPKIVKQVTEALRG